VDTAVADLKAIGAIEVVPRFEDKRQTSNLYRVLSATPLEAHAVTPLAADREGEVATNSTQNQSHIEPQSYEPEGADAPVVMSKKSYLHQSHFDAMLGSFGPPASDKARGVYASVAKKALEMGWGRAEMLHALNVWKAQEKDPRWARNPGSFLSAMPHLLSPMSLVDSRAVQAEMDDTEIEMLRRKK
jgi:hypothetical protein